MEDFDNKGWRPASDLHFTRRLEAIGLAVEEIGVASQSLPIAFLRDRDHWVAMAVFSPGDGLNRFLDPVTGHWKGPYIPALLRGYPFRLAADDDQTLQLWPGVAPEPLMEGVEPFTQDGEVTETVRAIHAHLRRAHRGIRQTHEAIALLNDCDVLVPLVLEQHQDQDAPVVLSGRPAYTLDADRLEGLDDTSFRWLRALDALNWVYAVQNSLHHLGRLREPRPKVDDMVFDKIEASPGGPDAMALSGLGRLFDDAEAPIRFGHP